jgi:hypothetical protein
VSSAVSSENSYGITLFIVGHAAPVKTREETVDWLKLNYSGIRIRALNQPNQHVPAAGYNVEDRKPEVWIPFVALTISPLQANWQGIRNQAAVAFAASRGRFVVPAGNEIVYLNIEREEFIIRMLSKLLHLPLRFKPSSYAGSPTA